MNTIARSAFLGSLLICAVLALGRFASAQDSRAAGVFIEGAVNRPGFVLFPPARPLSIVDALTLSGGHTANADLKRVWLYRAKLPDHREVIDVDAIMKRKAADVVLNDRDRVVVIGRDVDE
jgi:protein involved in polysaccharide export with SLBB domain